MALNNINIPLDIESIRVLNMETTEDGNIIIDVESTEEGTYCHRCGKFIDKFHGYDRAILLRHLPILDHPVYIRIRPKRFYCPYCKKRSTTTQTCDWYRANTPHTKAYEKFILREMVNATLVDVSIKQGIGQDAIEGIIDRHISTTPDWSALEDIRELGIDEIALKKGHQDFVTIISSRNYQNQNKVIAILPDRQKATVKQFLTLIPEALKPGIKRVCCDMYDGFVNAVYEVLPAAQVVVDRFHVAKHYRECADEVRKRELKRLYDELPEDKYEEIKHSMWPFRKPWKDLNEEEQKRLFILFSYSVEIREAYIFREALTWIFEQNFSKQQALGYLDIWQELIKEIGLECFEPFLVTLQQWSDEISNYFLDRQTSGFVEGLNNKVKVLKRRCYGIFNLGHFRQRLCLDLEGYTLFGRHFQTLTE